MPRRITAPARIITAGTTATPQPQLSPPGRGATPAVQVEEVIATWSRTAVQTEQTLTRMSETVRRFATRCAALGVADLRVVDLQVARGFVLAPTVHGQLPELATQHARRTALRTLYRTARGMGMVAGDPTMDLDLEPRGVLAARPLTDDEVTLCRASAQVTGGRAAPMRVTAWALGESTAVSSEITTLRICDLVGSDEPRSVQLPGTRRHEPRTVPLSAWGRLVLRARVAELHAAGLGDQALLAYGGGAPAGGAKAQASVCNALREVLNAAGLAREEDVRPASLRNWAGRAAYEAGKPVESVARLMGHRSLDATAEDIGLIWRSATHTPISFGANSDSESDIAAVSGTLVVSRHLVLVDRVGGVR